MILNKIMVILYKLTCIALMLLSLSFVIWWVASICTVLFPQMVGV
jgi:hypothetical protein